MKFIVTSFSNQLAIPLLDIILSFVTVLRDGFVRRAGICNKEIEKCIETTQAIKFFISTINAKPNKRRNKASEHPFSEYSLIAMEDILSNGSIHSPSNTYHRVQMIKSEHARHLQQTTNHLQCVYSRSHSSIASKWFHRMEEQVSQTVWTEILDLIIFMSKFNCRTDLPIKDLTSSALRYRCNIFACNKQVSRNGKWIQNQFFLPLYLYIIRYTGRFCCCLGNILTTNSSSKQVLSSFQTPYVV